MAESAKQPNQSPRQTWSAVGSMSLCVALLIASEFMPVSLLTPIAHDLHATEGMAGQAISISGLFAVAMSLLIATIAGRFDRRHVLMGLTAIMLTSLVLIAEAPNFLVLMAARALLGVVIGGFWSLATATVMRLVPAESVPKALGNRVHGKRRSDRVRCAYWQLSGRDHRMAWRLLGARANRSSDACMAVGQPADNAAASSQSSFKSFRAPQAAQCIVCHARSDVDLCGRVRDIHLSSAVP